MKAKEIKEQLEDIFEQAYTDYKDYDSFLTKESKKLAKDREEFTKFVTKNKGNVDLIVDKLYEVNEVPALYRNDLKRLIDKLTTIYLVVKDIIDIPNDVREEINLLPRPKMTYTIEDGKAVEVNVEHNKKVRENARAMNANYIKSLVQNL